MIMIIYVDNDSCKEKKRVIMPIAVIVEIILQITLRMLSMTIMIILTRVMIRVIILKTVTMMTAVIIKYNLEIRQW